MNQNLSSFLNASRWIAAFLVLVSHARMIVLVNLDNAEHATLPVKGFYVVTGLGHEAVVVFFVISGFLVGGLSLDRWRMRGPELRTYASARISRIYTALVPALLLGFALDYTGLHLFNLSAIYTDPARYHFASFSGSVGQTLSLPCFIGNLFMLQGVLTPILGSNGPLWSLSYEWWYYCLFALIGAACTGRGKKRIGYAIGAMILALLLPTQLLLWGMIWMLGLGVHAWVKSPCWKPHPLLGIGLFLVALVIARLHHGRADPAAPTMLAGAFLPDLSLGIAYSVAIVSASRLRLRDPFAKLNERLADFSYTTYLAHFPAMLFLVAAAYQVLGIGFRRQPTASGLAYFFILTAVVSGYCFLLSLVTERRTGAVRKKLDALLGVKPRRAEATSAPGPGTA